MEFMKTTNEEPRLVGYRCSRCGAIITKKNLTEEEALELSKNGNCAICYLGNLLQRDIAAIDAGTAI